MYSIQAIESTFTSLIQATQLPNFTVELYGWNRMKDDKSDPEMITFAQADNNYTVMSRTNQKIGCFTADVKNWDNQCYKAKMDCQKEEVGIGMRVYQPKRWGEHPMYLTMIDFNPGLTEQNRHTIAFWKEIESKYKGRKLYLFNSGNAHHALMDILMDDQGHYEWMSMLANHEEVVDQKWVRFANAHEHGGVIRTTTGRTRPQPKLWKWVNL
jgi:hypothetical protein